MGVLNPDAGGLVKFHRRGGVRNPAGFDPRTLPGLTLWLAGDQIAGLANADPLVNGTGWRDASGAGNHFSVLGGTAPTYRTNVLNGKPVVRFAANGSLRLVAGKTLADLIAAAAFSIFAVFKPTVIHTVADYNWPAVLTNQPAGYLAIAAVADGPDRVVTWRDGAGGLSITPISRTAFHLVSSRHDTGNLYMDRDAADEVSQAYGDTPAAALASSAGIGQSYNNAAQLDGDVAEIAVYNRALTASDRGQVKSYLSAKYALGL